jgi:hypothetical protein
VPIMLLAALALAPNLARPRERTGDPRGTGALAVQDRST